MDSWIIWLIVTIVATLGEMTITGFFLAPFAIGGLAAMIVDLIFGIPGLSIGVFGVGSIAGFMVLRPIAQKHLTTPPAIRTGPAALVGHTATVTQDADNERNQGAIRLDEGEVWTARPVDGALPLPAGTRVQIVEIRGATAVVAPDQ